jgi:hypothetical protein
VGPLKRLAYKPLPDDVKRLYSDAFRKATEQYRTVVAAVEHGQVHLANLNLDTGQPSRAGDYEPADKAYAELIRRHAEDHFARMPKDLGDDLLNHFRDHNAALAFDESDRDREKTVEALNELESSRGHGAGL